MPVCRIAASAEPAGRLNAPTCVKTLDSAWLPPHDELVASVVPALDISVSSGSASAPGTLNGAVPRVGPTPLRSTLLLPEPWITNPAMRIPLPVPTLALAERLTILPGTELGAVDPETVSVAAALVTELEPLVTVTVYVPAAADVADAIV